MATEDAGGKCESVRAVAPRCFGLSCKAQFLRTEVAHMAELVMAIDQGTTGTTVLVIDGARRIVGRAYGEIHQSFPQAGWVEHDAQEIFASAVALSRQALRAARASIDDLLTIGITNQRETTVVWERSSGLPVAPAIVWQCRRSADICQRLKAHEPEIRRRTGLVLDPYFSATKLKWLLDRSPDLRRRAMRGELCFGTVESWLIFKLSGGEAHITDYTNASRTMLLNLRTRRWDEEMLRLFNVPEAMLPCVVSSRGPLAETAAGTLGPRSVPIGSAIGDQQAALFGHGATRAGAAKVTYGTGAFLLMHTGERLVRSRNRLLTTIALGPAGEPAAALEGSIFVAGAVVQWLRDGLGIIGNAAETAALAAIPDGSVSQSEHIYFVPAFVGLGAPYWDSEARGAIFGLTRGATARDLVRAALEGIAYQVCDVLGAMERDCKYPAAELKVDGGAAANNYLLQFQADILGRSVCRAASLEATAMGGALLAGISAGLWQEGQLPPDGQAAGAVFEPRMAAAQRARRLRGWHDAVRRVLSHR
jgi:glycerol kinase